MDCVSFECDRLAAKEIARFQEQLIQKLTDEMGAHATENAPATGAITVSHVNAHEHEWTFARAFLYSLTILTTVGKSLHVLFIVPMLGVFLLR